MSGNKVFVGNLDYETKEDDLMDLFKSAGKIVEANVVRRGYRSKGYGFVVYENEEDAIKAVQQFDKVELLNRTINVQLSNSEGRSVSPRRNYNDNNRRTSPFRGDRDFNRRTPNRNSNRTFYNLRRPNNYDNDDGDDNGDDGDDNRDNRRYNDRRNNNVGYNRNYGNYGRNNGRDYGRNYGRNNGRDYGRNYDRDDRDYGNGRQNQRRPQRRFNDRDERKEVEKVESKTTIFVANLPFSVDDEELVQMFKKCGSIKTAHVVTNRGRSKGFGFVEFETQDGQKKAIEEMENFPVSSRNGEDRNLAVKVAMVDVEKEQQGEKDQEDKNQNENDDGDDEDDNKDTRRYDD